MNHRLSIAFLLNNPVIVVNVVVTGHRQRRSIGQSCNGDDDSNYAYFIDEELVSEKYLYCDKRTKQFQTASCPIANGLQKIFDEITGLCLLPQSRKRRQPTGTVAKSH